MSSHQPGVLALAIDFFAGYGATIEWLLSDNGSCYRAKDFAAVLAQSTVTPSAVPIEPLKRSGGALQQDRAQRVDLPPTLSLRVPE